MSQAGFIESKIVIHVFVTVLVHSVSAPLMHIFRLGDALLYNTHTYAHNTSVYNSSKLHTPIHYTHTPVYNPHKLDVV